MQVSSNFEGGNKYSLFKSLNNSVNILRSPITQNQELTIHKVHFGLLICQVHLDSSESNVS